MASLALVATFAAAQTFCHIVKVGVFAFDGFDYHDHVATIAVGAVAVTLETCALPNLGYRVDRELGPAEIVRITEEGVEQLLQILTDISASI